MTGRCNGNGKGIESILVRLQDCLDSGSALRPKSRGVPFGMHAGLSAVKCGLQGSPGIGERERMNCQSFLAEPRRQLFGIAVSAMKDRTDEMAAFAESEVEQHGNGH